MGVEASDWSSRQGVRLARLGVVLFLLALVTGLLVPRFRLPRLGLSAHLLGVSQGLFLMVIGLLWPKLELTRQASRVGFWLMLYGCFVAWAANVLGAIWGAGGNSLPMASGNAHGSALQEAIITASLRTAGASLIAALLLILWGLRHASAVRQP
jgi:hydroxylaminobenzene mutase